MDIVPSGLLPPVSWLYAVFTLTPLGSKPTELASLAKGVAIEVSSCIKIGHTKAVDHFRYSLFHFFILLTYFDLLTFLVVKYAHADQYMGVFVFIFKSRATC